MDTSSQQTSKTKRRSRRSFPERKQCLRNLLNKVDDLEEKRDYGLQTVEDIGFILKEINELEQEYPIAKRVEQTDETLLDCMILSTSSNILVKCINALDVSATSYEPTEFCNKLISTLKEGEDFRAYDLLKLLPDARTLIPEVNPYNYVYGYDMNKLPVPKQKKRLEKRPIEKFTKKQPEKVVSINKIEEGIEEIVKEFYAVLLEEYRRHGEEPINYYDYVIDTSSFSNTVENMFYCSFLVRDGKAKIDLDNRTPTIKPISKKELKKYREEDGINFQIISTIGKGEWEMFKNEGFLQKYKKSINKKS